MARKSMVAKVSYIGKHPRLGDGQTIPINLVLKHGYVDFTQDDDYDISNHDIIEKDWDFVPDLYEQDWYWNSTTSEFQITTP